MRIEELLKPSVYPHATGKISLRETNLAWIVLTGAFAYKIKKPVRLEFIDTTSLEARRHLCAEEIRLNSRLTKDLYCGVVEIAESAQGFRVGGEGNIVEYAVKMQQFDPGCELAAEIEAGRVSAADLTALADRMAEFHARADVREDDSQYLCLLRQSILGTIGTLIAHLPNAAEIPALEELVDWTHDTLHARAGALMERVKLGRVRECHGDLHARNIVRWRGSLTPFDCLEFDPKLRWIDTMSDVAFLFMDLLSRHRQDLAYAFIDRYAERTNDYTGLEHLRFFAVYRALVRAMVDALHAEHSFGTDDIEHLHRRVTAARTIAFPPSPLLLCMHGLSGAGKSVLSGQLVQALGAVRIRSDAQRAHLMAACPIPEKYSEANIDRIYARLLKCASPALLGGLSVILDATFLREEHRRSARELASSVGAKFIILDCEASEMELRRRIRERQTSLSDPSEANERVLEVQLASADTLSELEESLTIHIDTQRDSGALTSALTQLHAKVPGL